MTTKREHKFVNIHTTLFIDMEILIIIIIIIIICKGKPCSKHNKGNKIEKEHSCMLMQYHICKPLKEHKQDRQCMCMYNIVARSC
jgi:hypothetical protein